MIIINGKKFEKFESRLSKESAEIVANRERRNGNLVRIIKHKPSRSYNVYVWWNPRGY